jgi:hypothetical protein
MRLEQSEKGISKELKLFIKESLVTAICDLYDSPPESDSNVLKTHALYQILATEAGIDFQKVVHDHCTVFERKRMDLILL